MHSSTKDRFIWDNLLTRNPTILNIICWNDGLIWCSNYYLDTWWIKQWDMTVAWLFGFRKFQTVLPNWRKARHFTLRCLFIQSFQTFLDVKIDIKQVDLTSCQAHWVLQKIHLGGARDEHFSCFHSSCQLGLSTYALQVFQSIFTHAQVNIKYFLT